MSKHPDVYIGKPTNVKWRTDPSPDDDEFRGMPKEVVQILGFNPAEENMEKAKYTRRYKGPDGKWRYEYGKKDRKGGQSRAEIARRETKGEPVSQDLFDDAYAEKMPKLTGAAYNAQKEAIIDAFMDGGFDGEKRLQSYTRAFGKEAGKEMAADLYETGALSDMDYKMAVRAVEKVEKSRKEFHMSDVTLVVTPTELEKASKKVSHPAGTSKVQASATTNNPTNHKERMKFARMFAEMCGAGKPESASKHQPPTTDHKGREAGQKAPHDKGSTKVSGMRSQASNNFGARIMKPSEIGASAYKDPAKGGTVPSKKR